MLEPAITTSVDVRKTARLVLDYGDPNDLRPVSRRQLRELGYVHDEDFHSYALTVFVEAFGVDRPAEATARVWPDAIEALFVALRLPFASPTVTAADALEQVTSRFGEPLATLLSYHYTANEDGSDG